MSKFTRNAQSAREEPTGLSEFAAGASTRDAISIVQSPWDGMDPDAKPSGGITVRFNDYQRAVLQHLAQAGDRSVQWVILEMLMPAIAERVGDTKHS